MIFTLEILQADHGDCLLLHFGKTQKSLQTIIIDGGPTGIYKNFLKPRLLEVKEALSPNKPFPVSMVMISHFDDDHANGILNLTDEAVKLMNNSEPQLFEMNNFWFNAFDDVVGNNQVPGVASVSSASVADIASVPEFAGLDHHISAVVASTTQGRKLRDNASTLGAVMNNPFKPIKNGKSNLVRGDVGKSVIDWDGLKLTVLHPNKKRLDELQTKWDKDLAKLKKNKNKKAGMKAFATALADLDTSPFNLSSIVCLAEFGKKKILLTGDARSDDVLAGLKLNGLLDSKGRIHVDVLKMPHHGSERNLSENFLKQVTADHYVISASGRFDNPDVTTIQALGDVIKNGKKGILHLTNGKGELNLAGKLKKLQEKLKKEKSKLQFNIRNNDDLSIKLNLLTKIGF